MIVVCPFFACAIMQLSCHHHCFCLHLVPMLSSVHFNEIFYYTQNYAKFCRRDRYTPLACAAKSGKYEIMAYLLSNSEVSPEGIRNEKVIIHVYTLESF